MSVATASKPCSVPVEHRRSAPAWIGSVPDRWTIDRLRWTVTSCQNGIWGEEPDGVNDIPCVRVADFDRTAFRVAESIPTVRAVTASERSGRILQRGDLLLEKSGGGELQPVGVVVLYDHAEAAVCSNFVARMRVASGFDPRFLTYVHANLYAGRVNTRSIKQTTGIQNLDSMAYLDERAAWPPLPEQRAIAAWLDDRTKRIDELVAAKRRLIDLLAEQRTALITKAVTKGLNPDAPMKPSGIDWLGDVPRHWEMKRIKFIARVGNGSTPSRENPLYWSGDFPWLNSGVVNLREVTEASDLVTELALAECHLPIVEPPAVLVGITGEGKTRGMATVLRIEATINQHLAFVKPTRKDCDTEFMRFAIHSAYQFLRDESGGGGSTKGAITCDQLGNVAMPFPPHSEQRAIVAHIDIACAKFDSLTTAAEAVIARLNEYRQSLITAAVTGKIDVRKGATA